MLGRISPGSQQGLWGLKCNTIHPSHQNKTSLCRCASKSQADGAGRVSLKEIRFESRF